MPKLKQETCTFKVMQTIRQYDDFISVKDLMVLTGLTRDQIHASTDLLVKYKVIAVERVKEFNKVKQRVIEHCMFCALPPESDQRLMVHEERTPETKPRNYRQYDLLRKKFTKPEK